MTGFKKIYIEITNCCNLACNFCHRTDRSKVFMRPAVFAAVLEKIQDSTAFVSLHVLGEPLLHPEFDRLLALCRQHGLQVNLVTNGTLLGRHRQTLLTAPALRQVSISLHSLAQIEPREAEAHLSEILDFAREASAAGAFYVSLRLWNLQKGKDEAGDAWNDALLKRIATAFSVPALRVAALKADRGIPLAPRVFLNPEPQFSWPDLTAPDLGRQGSCHGLRDHLAILADGTVVPCCLDADGLLALGNILRQSLDEILSGPRARQIREGFENQHLVEPLCRRCSYRQRFSASAPS